MNEVTIIVDVIGKARVKLRAVFSSGAADDFGPTRVGQGGQQSMAEIQTRIHHAFPMTSTIDISLEERQEGVRNDKK